ncbi:DUF3231 family protein [uncultured Paenibacillus sp.]|uniref:DUF3231 family protein n=1 Tax=uncultured Paenibacillus sp. TaxID=227322 RepID=UPI0028D4B65F|nr:DUF3231 family protein [uncultured Paenibacillus sp.]
MTDEETANLLAYNLVIGIMSAARGFTEAVRPDVGMMFMKYQLTKATFGVTFKDLMQQRGWFSQTTGVIQPYYV